MKNLLCYALLGVRCTAFAVQSMTAESQQYVGKTATMKAVVKSSTGE